VWTAAKAGYGSSVRPDLPDQPLVFLDGDGPLIPFKTWPVNTHRSTTYAEPV
jgi:hypothetical protein